MSQEITKMDETVEGGKYIVGDRYVDANGKDLGAVRSAGKGAEAAQPAAGDEFAGEAEGGTAAGKGTAKNK